MKSGFLIILGIVGFVFIITSIPHSEAERIVLELDQMAEFSDAIVIGTIESTWIDVRPFDDYIVVDTAKVKVDEWLKNDKNSDILEIRYYGYWAKTIDDLRGKIIFDNPFYSYESGQKVLLILDHEDQTSVMGEGYYPLFEGSFVINDDIAISQSGEQMSLQSLYKVINNVDEKSTEILPITEPEPKTTNMQCIPTDYEKTRKCLANYHCDVDENPELNKECIETYDGISIREMCSNPDNIIIQKSNGCMVLPLVGSKNCGSDFACPETP